MIKRNVKTITEFNKRYRIECLIEGVQAMYLQENKDTDFGDVKATSVNGYEVYDKKTNQQVFFFDSCVEEEFLDALWGEFFEEN